VWDGGDAGDKEEDAIGASPVSHMLASRDRTRGASALYPGARFLTDLDLRPAVRGL
jgi:hypothetical protein